MEISGGTGHTAPASNIRPQLRRLGGARGAAQQRVDWSRVVLRPQQTAAECADGWCCEHHCHRAPPRGRLRRARQPHLRQGTGGTAARARNAFITVVFH